MPDAPDEPPVHAVEAVAFAETVAAEYAARGGQAKDLFAAFVGLVSARDRVVAADCMLAVEAAVIGRNGMSPSRS